MKRCRAAGLRHRAGRTAALFCLNVMGRWRSLRVIVRCKKMQEAVRRILAFQNLFTEFANPQIADTVFCAADISCAFCKYFTFL